MARIRTIKPAFFKHEGLFDAEAESGLPIRLAFAGLWTQCDREGRFRWRPRQLKTDILPYDDVDFSRVLDALATRGFVVRYEHDGEWFGCIPSFLDHQVINNREAQSELPTPPEAIVNTSKDDAIRTRDSRVLDATGKCTSGKGKGKGKEEEKEKEEKAVVASSETAREAAAARSMFDQISSECHAALPAEATWKIKISEDIAPIFQCLKDGADLHADAVPAIKAVAERALKNGKKINSWGFFTEAIRERMQARQAASGIALAPPKSPEQQHADNERVWRRVLETMYRIGRWDNQILRRSKIPAAFERAWCAEHGKTLLPGRDERDAA